MSLGADSRESEFLGAHRVSEDSSKSGSDDSASRRTPPSITPQSGLRRTEPLTPFDCKISLSKIISPITEVVTAVRPFTIRPPPDVTRPLANRPAFDNSEAALVKSLALLAPCRDLQFAATPMRVIVDAPIRAVGEALGAASANLPNAACDFVFGSALSIGCTHSADSPNSEDAAVGIIIALGDDGTCPSVDMAVAALPGLVGRAGCVRPGLAFFRAHGLRGLKALSSACVKNRLGLFADIEIAPPSVDTRTCQETLRIVSTVMQSVKQCSALSFLHISGVSLGVARAVHSSVWRDFSRPLLTAPSDKSDLEGHLNRAAHVDAVIVRGKSSVAALYSSTPDCMFVCSIDASRCLQSADPDAHLTACVVGAITVGAMFILIDRASVSSAPRFAEAIAAGVQQAKRRLCRI